MRITLFLCVFALIIGCTACAFTDTGSVNSGRGDGSSESAGEHSGTTVSVESNLAVSAVAAESEIPVPAEVTPVGTKTAVEKVATYSVGRGGVWRYIFDWNGKPQPEDTPSIMGFSVQIDANEDVYVSNGFGKVTRLRDGKEWETELAVGTPDIHGFNDFVVSNGYIYMVFGYGLVEQYDMDGNLVETHTGCAEREIDFMFPYLDADGKVYLKAVMSNRYFRIDGTPIPGTTAPLRIGDTSEEVRSIPSIAGDFIGSHGFAFVKFLSEQSEPDSNHNCSLEFVYQTYHQDGTLLSNFRVMEICSTEKSAGIIPYDEEGNTTGAYTNTVSIDEIVFEEVLFCEILHSENGGLYLALYFGDRMELYRVTPGHTEGLELGALEDLFGSEERSEAVLAETAVCWADEINAVVPDPSTSNHILTTTYLQFASRAKQMFKLTWTLKKTQTEVPAADKGRVTVANYLIEAATSGKTIMTGIPYCYGGFNGLDTVSSYGTKFTEAIKSAVYAGNVNHNCGGYQGDTVGLDCSGFVSSAYGLKVRKSSYDFRLIGCKATSISQLRVGDILVTNDKVASSARHVMIYGGNYETDSRGEYC